MFQILTPDQFITSAWKNGGGVTHEIARSEQDGAWVWRLSIAEVAADGPFSRFDGLSRILTVIEGKGIDLHSPDGILPAAFLSPVRFSGDLPVDSRLMDGPIRDLNVIYNAKLIDADVQVNSGPCIINTNGHHSGFLCLKGQAFISGRDIPRGAFALGHYDSIDLKEGALGILVSLKSTS